MTRCFSTFRNAWNLGLLFASGHLFQVDLHCRIASRRHGLIFDSGLYLRPALILAELMWAGWNSEECSRCAVPRVCRFALRSYQVAGSRVPGPGQGETVLTGFERAGMLLHDLACLCTWESNIVKTEYHAPKTRRQFVYDTAMIK